MTIVRGWEMSRTSDGRTQVSNTATGQVFEYAVDVQGHGCTFRPSTAAPSHQLDRPPVLFRQGRGFDGWHINNVRVMTYGGLRWYPVGQLESYANCRCGYVHVFHKNVDFLKGMVKCTRVAGGGGRWEWNLRCNACGTRLRRSSHAAEGQRVWGMVKVEVVG